MKSVPTLPLLAVPTGGETGVVDINAAPQKKKSLFSITIPQAHAHAFFLARIQAFFLRSVRLLSAYATFHIGHLILHKLSARAILSHSLSNLLNLCICAF